MRTCVVCMKKFTQNKFEEGPEGGTWELGFAHFLAGKMGFHALRLAIHQQKKQ